MVAPGLVGYTSGAVGLYERRTITVNLWYNPLYYTIVNLSI